MTAALGTPRSGQSNSLAGSCGTASLMARARSQLMNAAGRVSSVSSPGPASQSVALGGIAVASAASPLFTALAWSKR